MPSLVRLETDLLGYDMKGFVVTECGSYQSPAET